MILESPLNYALSTNALIQRPARKLVRVSSQYLVSNQNVAYGATTQNWTLSFWVYCSDAVNTNQVLICSGVRTPAIALNYTGGGAAANTIALYSAALRLVLTFDSSFYNKWNHVCMVRTKTGVANGYLNGVYNATYTAGSLQWTDALLYIGWDTSAGRYPNCLLADVAFWKAALSPNMIARLAEGYSPAEFQNRNPIFYFPFNGNDKDYYGKIVLTPTNNPAWTDRGPLLGTQPARTDLYVKPRQGYLIPCAKTPDQGAGMANSAQPLIIRPARAINSAALQYLTSTAVVAHNIGTGDFTFSAWVYTLYNGGPTYEFIWYNVGDNAVFTGLAAEVWGWYVGGSLLSNPNKWNAWQHYAIVRKSGVVKAYYNGRFQSSAADASNLANAVWDIGRGAPGFVSFNGRLSDMAWWKEALTPNDIARLADGYSPAMFSFKNPIAYFPFNGSDADYYGKIKLTPAANPVWTDRGPLLRTPAQPLYASGDNVERMYGSNNLIVGYGH